MIKLFFTAACLLLVSSPAFAAKQTLTSTDTGAQSRTKLNANFTDLYTNKANASCFASESAFNACFDLTWAAGGSGYTNLTSFVDQTAWRVFYSDGSGDVKELALGASGTVLKSNGASAAPSFQADDVGSGSFTYPGAGVPNSTGSAWGTSYTVGTAANNLVQLNASSQLPAVSAALLTNFPTLNQNTTGSAATLTTARTIAGTSFNGSANIDISYANLTNRPTLGTSAQYNVGTGANNIIQLNSSGELPFDIPSKANASCFASESAFNACFDLTWATGGYTNLTSFVAQTPWRVFYSNADGDVVELALGASGTVLKSNGASAAPSFQADATAEGAGYVSTPPTYSDEACTAGQYALSESYRYDCISSGNWNRTALTDWNNPQPVTPTLTSRVIGTNGTTLTLTGSASLSVGAGGNGGFDVDCGTAGSGITATYASGAPGTDLVYTLGTTVNSGDTCDLDYTQPGNGIEATTGGADLASITSASITNNSTQGGSTTKTDAFTGTGALDSNWTRMSTGTLGAQTVVRNTDKARSNTYTGYATALYTGGTQLNANQYAQVVLGTEFDYTGVAVRMTTGGNGYVLRCINTTTCAISSVTAGEPTALGATLTTTDISGKTLKLEASGTTLTAYVDGSSIGSRTDSTYSAAGYPGVTTRDSGANAAIDNFEAGNL